MADKTKIVVDIEFEHTQGFPKICGILVNGERQDLKRISEDNAFDRSGTRFCIIDFGLDDSIGVITLHQYEG